MKRRTVILPTFLLSVALLSACGNNSQTAISTDSTVKNETAENATTGVKTISEALSNDKIICYGVSAMDKSQTPTEIYFFDTGKLTIIPGKEFGKTLGELSQMEESEIWKQYEEVRTTYADKYIQDQEATRQRYIEFWEGGVSQLEESYGADNVKASPDGYIWNSDFTYAEMLEEIERLNNATCKGPFYDLEFTIVVETDATGNYTETERVVYPTINYDITYTQPTEYTTKNTIQSIDIDATVEGSEVQIYDTTYKCIPLSGGETLCTTALLTVDGAASENVLIDPTSEELIALYKDVVNARYE